MRVDYATSHTIARIIQTCQQNPPKIGTKTHIAPIKIKDINELELIQFIQFSSKQPKDTYISFNHMWTLGFEFFNSPAHINILIVSKLI